MSEKKPGELGKKVAEAKLEANKKAKELLDKWKGEKKDA